MSPGHILYRGEGPVKVTTNYCFGVVLNTIFQLEGKMDGKLESCNLYGFILTTGQLADLSLS